MSYEVAIIADSLAPSGARLTTFQLKYPRFIHAEVMTHRQFSRNASSTRAIPTAKMIEWVQKDPAMPVYWGQNRPGMQARDEIGWEDRATAIEDWMSARDEAVKRARHLTMLDVHKQVVGRILEPFAHINVVVSATDYSNFFALRCDRAAMPEIQKLAVMMARAYRDSKPAPSKVGRWHVPYVTDAERETYSGRDKLKISVARCARVSYMTFEGKEPDPEADMALHDRLLESRHMSPFEHQAQAMGVAGQPGNFRGWRQYRKTLNFDAYESFDFARLDEYGDQDFMV